MSLTIHSVIYEFQVANYKVLKLDTKNTDKPYTKYLINGIEYDIVPLYDIDNCIAIESNEFYDNKTC